MASQKHPVSIPEYGGHAVFFFVTELDGTADLDLNRWLGDGARQRNAYDPDAAQFAMLRKGIEGLKIDGKTYSLENQKKYPPRIRDEEGKPLIYEMLGHVIKYNPFLVEDFAEAFEEWVLDDVEGANTNPTPFRAVSE
jgi:hypothetical protein